MIKLQKNTVAMLTKKAIATLMLAMVLPTQPAAAQTTTANTHTYVALAQSENVTAFEITNLVPETPDPTVQDVLLSVCTANGYGQDCAQTLLGMLWNESQNISTAVGDHGKARGYFQIWTNLHHITVACAEDLTCSATWTLHYMEAHNYPKYVSYAVQCHNSCGANNGYAAKAARNGKRLWDTPLAVTQEAPVQLALN